MEAEHTSGAVAHAPSSAGTAGRRVLLTVLSHSDLEGGPVYDARPPRPPHCCSGGRYHSGSRSPGEGPGRARRFGSGANGCARGRHRRPGGNGAATGVRAPGRQSGMVGRHGADVERRCPRRAALGRVRAAVVDGGVRRAERRAGRPRAAARKRWCVEASGPGSTRRLSWVDVGRRLSTWTGRRWMGREVASR